MEHLLHGTVPGPAGSVSAVHQETGARQAPLTEGEPTAEPPPAQRRRPGVALLEDDGEMRRLLAEVLRAQGYLVDVFPDGASWLTASFGSPDRSGALRCWQVIISDIRMPGLSGLTVLRIAKLGSPSFPSVILITAFGDEETYAEKGIKDEPRLSP